MNNLSTYIAEKLHINKDIKVKEYHYHPKDKDELITLLKELLEERGKDADLNDIDVSNITDMANMFYSSKFDGDISKWDVNNVTNMTELFYKSNFNGDISKWNVYRYINTGGMFDNSTLEKNPPK